MRISAIFINNQNNADTFNDNVDFFRDTLFINSENMDIVFDINSFAESADGDILISFGTCPNIHEIKELYEVLHISEQHVAVSPRGNNMGLLSVPAHSENNVEELSLLLARSSYDAIIGYLPRYHIVPYISPMCVLLSGKLIKKFGFLSKCGQDVAYEILAWCSEMAEIGYSNIAANKVFIISDNKYCISDKYFKEHKSSSKLTKNYKNYGFYIFDKFASLATTSNNAKPKILLSMHELSPVHNGTAEHTFALAKRLVKKYSDIYEFHVLISSENAIFFDVYKDFPYVIFPEKLSGEYSLGITFAQIRNLDIFNILNKHCLKIITTVLDLIFYRCSKLAVVYNVLTFQQSIQYCDGIITISNTVKNDLISAFPNDADNISNKTRAILITSPDKHKEPDIAVKKVKFEKFILLFGNHYEHKLLGKIAPYLKEIQRNFVAVGLSKRKQSSNIQTFESGALSYNFIDFLYKNCEALLFPSEYEGFGLPIISALKYGKTVIVSDTDINREIMESFPQYKNKFIFFHRLTDLRDILETNVFVTDLSPAPLNYSYDDVAHETEKFISEILKQPVNFSKLFARNELLTMANNSTDNISAVIKFFLKAKHPRIFRLLKSIKKMRLC